MGLHEGGNVSCISSYFKSCLKISGVGIRSKKIKRSPLKVISYRTFWEGGRGWGELYLKN